MYFLLLVYFIYIPEYEHLSLYFKAYDFWDLLFLHTNDRKMHFQCKSAHNPGTEAESCEMISYHCLMLQM